MFTGIITDIGDVRSIEQRGDTRFVISAAYDMDGVEIGASIACSGPCLTVIDRANDDKNRPGGWFAVDVSAETLSKTVLGNWQVGTRINLERALKVGDELGGHIVSGHIDGVATVDDIRPEGDSLRFSFSAPGDLARFIAPKGSVALDGVSLTVNEVNGACFGVNIIPHTAERTTLGGLKPGDPVHIEIDPLARYVARLLETGAPRNG